jgi:hypothetical protein
LPAGRDIADELGGRKRSGQSSRLVRDRTASSGAGIWPSGPRQPAFENDVWLDKYPAGKGVAPACHRRYPPEPMTRLPGPVIESVWCTSRNAAINANPVPLPGEYSHVTGFPIRGDADRSTSGRWPAREIHRGQMTWIRLPQTRQCGLLLMLSLPESASPGRPGRASAACGRPRSAPGARASRGAPPRCTSRSRPGTRPRTCGGRP